MQESTDTVDSSVHESPSKFKINALWFKIIFAVVILIISSIAIAPFFFSRYASESRITLLSTHDMYAHFAFMTQFDKVLRSGVYYPRWLPDINNDYGIATMNFYPPGFYYLTSLFHALFNNWEKTMLVITLLSLAGSGLAFYLLSRQFYSRMASAIGAVFYVLLPYHTLDLYWRGAMPEFLGFVFLPLIIYFVYKVGTEGRPQHYAGLGLFYGLHLITHFPVSYLFTYALAIYAVIWATRDRDWKVALRIGCGMALGLLLGAVYWLPAALESKYTQEPISEIFPYHKSLITLTPGANPFDDVVNYTFMVQGLAILIAFFALRVPLLKILYGQDSGKLTQAQSQTRLWIVMAFVTTLLCTMFAFPIVTRIPKIQATVPAWRWLAIASLFTSLLVSAAIHYLRPSFEASSVRLWGYRLAIAIVIAMNLWITVHYVIGGALKNPTFTAFTKFVEGGFTPRGATLPDQLPDIPLTEATPPQGDFEVIRWQPQSREVRVNVSQPCFLRLKTYNFPGWTARLDGQKTPILTDHNGIQLVQIPAGIHKLEVFFVNTPPRTFGAILFGLSLLTIIGLTVAGRWTYRRAAYTHNQALSVESASATETVNTEIARPSLGKLAWGNQKNRRIIMFGVLGLAGIAILLIFIKPFQNNTSTPDSTSSGTRLEVAGVKWIMVASDENALNELMNVLPKGDENAVETLVQSGKVLRVPNGTSIRILETVSVKTKVRILTGEQTMKEGWVFGGWIKN